MPNLRQIVGLQEREPTVPPIRWFLGWLRDSKAKPGVSQIWATQNLNFPMSVASLGKIIQGKFLVFVYLIQCCWEVGREEIKAKKGNVQPPSTVLVFPLLHDRTEKWILIKSIQNWILFIRLCT